MRPLSFDLSLGTEWSLWVLAHGLPELPGPDLFDDQSVPVGYWIGSSTAAVLHIRRVVDEDEPGPVTETDVELFCLVNGSWEQMGGGGGGWVDNAPLARTELPPNWVNLYGTNCGAEGERGCKALWGEVGTEAAFAEVRQGDHVTRRAVEAPTGAFVVCADYEQPFTVRVLGSRGELLAEIDEPAGFDEIHPWSW